MHYLVAIIAVLGIVVIGSQLLLLVPEGWPSTGVAVLTFLAAVWSARYILRRARR
jgi:hypothetical protein